MSPDDDLRLLAPVEPPTALMSRVQRALGEELAAARRPRWRVIAGRSWTRVAVPAAIVFSIMGYLHWAVQAASALYR